MWSEEGREGAESARIRIKDSKLEAKLVNFYVEAVSGYDDTTLCVQW